MPPQKENEKFVRVPGVPPQDPAFCSWLRRRLRLISDKFPYSSDPEWNAKHVNSLTADMIAKGSRLFCWARAVNWTPCSRIYGTINSAVTFEDTPNIGDRQIFVEMSSLFPIAPYPLWPETFADLCNTAYDAAAFQFVGQASRFTGYPEDDQKLDLQLLLRTNKSILQIPLPLPPTPREFRELFLIKKPSFEQAKSVPGNQTFSFPGTVIEERETGFSIYREAGFSISQNVAFSPGLEPKPKKPEPPLDPISQRGRGLDLDPDPKRKP